MTKILCTNDWHLMARAPGSRTDNIVETLYGKLDQVERIAADAKVDALAIAGDLFHTPTVPDRLKTDLLRRFAGWRWPVLTIAGNHDEPYHNPTLLPDSSYGVLEAAGAIRDVSRTPWVAGGVAVGGCEYPVSEASLTAVAQLLPSDRPALVMIHAFGSLGGKPYFDEPVYAYDKVGRMIPQGKVFLFGHDHSDKGIERLGDQWFVQLGSLLRGSLSDDQVDRTPAVAVATFHEGQATVERHNLTVAPAATVFDLARKTRAETATAQIAQYVEELGATTAAVEANPVADLSVVSVSEDIRRAAEGYIRRASEGRA